MENKIMGTIGTIGRFKPLHKGSLAMLESICEVSEHVKIVVGSINKVNARNAFSVLEVEDMINLALEKKHSNYEIFFIQDYAHIPEFADGQKWRNEIKKIWGPVDYVVTANEYVRELMKEDYNIIHPSRIVPKDKWIYVKGSMVRNEMAKGRDWQRYVPEVVATYLENNGLVKRFVEQFGLETLTDSNYMMNEDSQKERIHTLEV